MISKSRGAGIKICHVDWVAVENTLTVSMHTVNVFMELRNMVPETRRQEIQSDLLDTVQEAVGTLEVARKFNVIICPFYLKYDTWFD